ncbi:BTAD domain-containing putative transcriptional regulator [Actinokineospora xionganensis]|uniref:LysM peptidoglycan-binding domain-containing protein n=1 Tax=Actinokineospora xionganensis TaxID=2684470 RepID=A0ABR7LFU6_9PSEU|nr:BTAD domain-containing putative transcriptional regulator [Actinokineospora xionganensis]MBC6451358.1 LysM peptidoglycan-binding domain-containing protein [Actinokineospora xionganensis]
MTRHRIRARAATITRGLVAAACLATIVLGVPAALITYGTNPLSSDLPNWTDIRTTLLRPDDGTLLLAVLQITVWLLWAIFTGFVVAEAVSQLRGRTLPRVPGLALLQQPAAALVTAAAVLVAINTATTPLHAAATIVATAPDDPEAVPRTVAEPAIQEAKPATELPRYTVRRYDSLWRIAERHLGDGLRWREIHTLNADRLPNPDRIEPGMILLLPADATGLDHTVLREVAVRPGDTLSAIAQRELGEATLWPTVFDANRGRIQPNGTPFTNPDKLHAGFTILLPPTSPATSQNTPTAQPPTAVSPSPRETRPPTSTSNPVLETPTTQPPPASTTDQQGESHEVTMPSGAVVGLSLAAAITAATTLLWIHRRRRYQPRPIEQLTRPAPLPESVRTLRRAHAHNTSRDSKPHATDPASPAAPIAFTGHTEIQIDPVALRGVGLTGPGTHAAARAVLTAQLAHHQAHELEILIPRTDFTRIFPSIDDQAVPLPENLTIVDSLDAALNRLEVEQIHRARLLDDNHATDMAAVRAADPSEPLPITLLAATPEQRHIRRLTAILQFAADRDIGAVLFGESPTGPTYTVGPDGFATTRAHEPELTTNLRFFTLSGQDALDLLAVLAEAQGSPPVTPADDITVPVEPVSDHETRHGFPESLTQQSPAIDTPEPSWTQHSVSLALFGPQKLTVHDTEIATGLRTKTRELLLYLALHRRGATQDQVLEALWPDIEISRAKDLLHAAVSNARKVLRGATGQPDEKFLLFTADRYSLDPVVFDVDLWRFERALDQAARATEPTDRLDALREATEQHTGELGAELGFEWLDVEREHLRRRALDARTAIADIHEPNDPDRALTVLEEAINYDPYAEDLYARIMRTQALLGRRDAIHRTYRLLQARLAEIGADPDETTYELFQNLLRTARSGSSPPRQH